MDVLSKLAALACNGLKAIPSLAASDSHRPIKCPKPQTLIIYFDPGTGAVTSHWYNITLSLLPNSTDETQTAKVLAAVGVAIYDASIAGWKQKYTYLFWRPITAIR
jgi:hypothetical protein